MKQNKPGEQQPTPSTEGTINEFRCHRETIICRGTDTLTVAPNGALACLPHAKEDWAAWTREERKRLGLPVAPVAVKDGLPAEWQAIRWGVTFTLEGVSRPVKGGWTDDFFWPYRAHREALGLQKKYPAHMGKIKDWGKHGKPASVQATA